MHAVSFCLYRKSSYFILMLICAQIQIGQLQLERSDLMMVINV